MTLQHHIQIDELGPFGDETALLAFCEALDDVLEADDRVESFTRSLSMNRHGDVTGYRYAIEGTLCEDGMREITDHTYNHGAW